MTLAQPVVIATAAVTLLAALLYMYMSIAVGQMRGKHKIQAPTMTGHPELERAIRVHYNTLESLPVFFAGLWLATLYFHPAAIPLLGWAGPILGLIWVIGRVLYMRGYMAAPEKRELGFGIAALSLVTLIVLSIIGLVMTWMVVSA